MPELPEVETVKLSLKKELVKQKVCKTEIRNRNLRWPVEDDLPQKINNSVVLDIIRKGKVLCLKLTDGFLMFHLGMTGKILIKDHSYLPVKHDHVIITLTDFKLVYNDARRFGYVEWSKSADRTYHRFTHKGPDPFDADFTLTYLQSQLNKSRVEIKSSLMNDKILTGIGNIYANELLFRAKIHPQKRSCQLSTNEMMRLFDNIRPLLEESILLGGSTLKDYVDSYGKRGTFQEKHQVYNHEGDPCAICNHPIERIIIAGRSTFFCPVCQKN